MRRSVRSISRDDLALAVMHGGSAQPTAGLAPQEDRWPPRLEDRVLAPPRQRRSEPHLSHARERFAQAAVGLGDQERKLEHARPRLPFGDDVGAVAGAIERQRKGMVAMLEDERDRAGV